MASNTQTTMLTGRSQQPVHLVPQSLFIVQEKAAMWQQIPPSQTHSILSPSTGVPSSQPPSQMGTNEGATVKEGFSTKTFPRNNSCFGQNCSLLESSNNVVKPREWLNPPSNLSSKELSKVWKCLKCTKFILLNATFNVFDQEDTTWSII